jgi:g-D-glutamyl-meso-diaminopimelate peptidase
MKRSGFYAGDITGVFDDAVRAAVISFQRSFGLTPDGVVGKNTWQSLMPFLRGYHRYRVKRGDSFYTISQAFYTTLRSILTANPTLDPQNLQIGQYIYVPYGFDVVATNVSYTHAFLEIIMEGLTARYPFLTSGTIGTSVMGREIYFLSIGRGPVQVSYNASHHANEWITTPVLLKFIEQYAKAYSAGERLNSFNTLTMYNSSNLYLIPMVNPDGVDLVTGGIPRSNRYYTQAEALSRNYPQIPFPSGWKANIAGIDPNLSYPARWEQARDIKFAQGFTEPGPRDFVGTAPLSARESRAMYDFTLNHDFALTLSYHSQGEVIYWRFADYLPPRSEEIVRLMEKASGYTAEVTPSMSANAGYKDWFIQTYNRPGYTVEVGLGENPLPLSQFDKIYSDNIGILTLGITEMI